MVLDWGFIQKKYIYIYIQTKNFKIEKEIFPSAEIFQDVAQLYHVLTAVIHHVF